MPSFPFRVLSRSSATIGFVVVIAVSAPAETAWPQFRGPNAAGLAPDARPPVRIGPAEGVRWKVEVPWSPSSPIVSGENLFLTTFHDGQLEVRAHRMSDGALRWARAVKPERIEEHHRSDGSPAASTPVTDGKHVASYFGSFGLICHDFEGREIWRRPLPVAESGGKFGTGTSPILIGHRLVVNRDQYQGSSLLCVDVATGRTLWDAPRPEATGSFGCPVHWKTLGSTKSFWRVRPR